MLQKMVTELAEGKSEVDLAHLVMDIEGCYPSMPKAVIRVAMRDVLNQIKSGLTRCKRRQAAVAVPKRSSKIACLRHVNCEDCLDDLCAWCVGGEPTGGRCMMNLPGSCPLPRHYHASGMMPEARLPPHVRVGTQTRANSRPTAIFLKPSQLRCPVR